MRKKSLKVAVLAAMAGTLLQFGGCLGDGFLRLVLADVVAQQASGLIPDLGLGDLLGGGGAAADGG